MQPHLLHTKLTKRNLIPFNRTEQSFKSDSDSEPSNLNFEYLSLFSSSHFRSNLLLRYLKHESF
jgi:hypothetical protein